jgi:bombesin receptor subtype-3
MANQSENMGFSENSHNDSYVEEQYVPYHLRPETYIVPVVFGIIFIAGVVGNGSLLMMFCRNKDMRSVPNTLIFNLALGDLLVLLVSVPFTATIYTFESWPYGAFMCKFTEFAKDTSVGVSVFTLVALSADRYFAIVHSVRRRVRGSQSKRMICSIVFIWILAAGLALPGALFSHIMTFDIGNTTNETTYIKVCYPFPSDFGPQYPKVIVMAKALSLYIVPLLIIGSFYSVMGHHLLRSTNALPGQAAITQSGDSSPRVSHVLCSSMAH